jgi:hypothetical protein
MNSPIRAISSVLVFCSLGLLSFSCASEPKIDGMLEQPIRLIMSDFRNDTEMTLVNDAWLQRQGFTGVNANARKAAFFSVTRGKNKTTTKVLDNRQAALLVNHMRTEFDFNVHAVSGPTPPGGGYFSSAVEIEVAGRSKHFGYQRDLPRDAVLDLVEIKKVFVAVYNQVYSLQSVEDAEGFKKGLGRR